MDQHIGNDRLGVVTAPRTLRLERLLPGPVERVWAYLTESDKRAKWLASGPMADFVGGPVKLTFQHSHLSDEKTPAEFQKYEGSGFESKVLRYEPPHLLVITWPDGGQDSEVTFELSASGSDTLLKLTHTRLASTDSMVSVASGWHAHLGVLIDHLEGKVPAGFWSNYQRVRDEYSQVIKD
ncbi:SRPBCC family protein [Phyllobacterium sp. UNC302MFCol5.2]|uniref:SRPBCC family protein n=1 Tax=Phyllobacterium sp. UNC302MFCol5.2 TaxID=1449065 RepID=UPI000485CD3C|nr:SRPBCC family protein [Phyllobacterium sp. UNC302MFCol5.2]